MCDETFMTAKLLSDHNRTHTVNNLTCTECDYLSSNKTELKKHMKTHTGEKKGSNKKELSTSSETNITNKKASLRNN